MDWTVEVGSLWHKDSRLEGIISFGPVVKEEAIFYNRDRVGDRVKR